MLKSKYFRTIEDIEKYAEESVSSIYYLLLSVAGVKDVHADHAASHLGKAQGIANILRYGGTLPDSFFRLKITHH